MKTEAGQRLADRYTLEESVGSGGMAEVWRARDEVLGRSVAVKILHEHLAGDRQIFERFRREAVTAARLSHPAVVRVFDTGVDGERCFIVLELIAHHTLADVLEEEGPLSPDRAVPIVRGILDGLTHAHRHGIVHRDLKPANVLVHDGHVKVADFGIAKAAFTGDLTATGELLGTAAYLAPEQVEGSDVDHRADLYAVGVILYEMLTGRRPFEADTAIAAATLRLTTDPPPPGSLRAGIPPGLEAVVLRALARDPDERFQSADEMRGVLERAATSAPERVPPAVSHPPPRQSTFRRWMLVPTLAILATVVALAVGLLIGRLELGGPLGVRPKDDPSPSPTGDLQELTVEAVEDHDPLGDGEEHGEEAPLATDGDPESAWLTEHYTSPDLGGIKPGVGLMLDLGSTRDVREIVILSPSPGWTFEIHGSEDPGDFDDPSSPFEDENGETSFVAEEETALAFPDARARYVLIWITELSEHEGEYRTLIAEAALAGG